MLKIRGNKYISRTECSVEYLKQFKISISNRPSYEVLIDDVRAELRLYKLYVLYLIWNPRIVKLT